MQGEDRFLLRVQVNPPVSRADHDALRPLVAAADASHSDRTVKKLGLFVGHGIFRWIRYTTRIIVQKTTWADQMGTRNHRFIWKLSPGSSAMYPQIAESAEKTMMKGSAQTVLPAKQYQTIQPNARTPANP
jgi:hypothetical protein